MRANFNLFFFYITNILIFPLKCITILSKGDSMNEIYSFHKELNIKKIIFAIIFILIIIIAMVILVYRLLFASLNENTADAYTTFSDSNNSINLTLPQEYGLKQVNSESTYVLELKSDKNLAIFISYEDLLVNRNLTDIANADINTYIKEFSEVSDLSGLEEFKTDDSFGYTYSFNYLDQQTETVFYLQVIWIETNNGYYIMDFEFPLEDLNDYTDLINQSLDNFEIII